MYQLEPMMAEEIIMSDSCDGLTEFLESVFVWGKRIMIYIEGKIK
jgi:hypothetical protein